MDVNQNNNEITLKNNINKKLDKLGQNELKLVLLYINKLHKKKENVNHKRDDIDKTTDKYKILLLFVNGILKNIGKEEIDDLVKFRDIDRLDIIKQENKVLLDEMAPTLFKHFNKNKCGYYRKTKNLPLNCLRGMCKEMGFVFKKRQFTKTIKCKVTCISLYTIF